MTEAIDVTTMMEAMPKSGSNCAAKIQSRINAIRQLGKELEHVHVYPSDISVLTAGLIKAFDKKKRAKPKTWELQISGVKLIPTED